MHFFEQPTKVSRHPVKSKFSVHLFKNHLRNRLVADKYETVRLHNNGMRVMKRDIFQAIADPTRRAILVLIAANAMTPNAIADHFEITRQATSKHIKILNECGVLETEKAGREIYYQLKLEKMAEIDMWLEQFRKLWESRYAKLDTLLDELKGHDNDT